MYDPYRGRQVSPETNFHCYVHPRKVQRHITYCAYFLKLTREKGPETYWPTTEVINVAEKKKKKKTYSSWLRQPDYELLAKRIIIIIDHHIAEMTCPSSALLRPLLVRLHFTGSSRSQIWSCTWGLGLVGACCSQSITMYGQTARLSSRGLETYHFATTVASFLLLF
jgi:hypothetical protein